MYFARNEKKRMRKLEIKQLQSGGLITNYYCVSKCKHCLYGCSPLRSKAYISPESAERLLSKSQTLGCGQLHIGGGEPMLNTAKLAEILQVFGRQGVVVEYVETNSSWYKNQAQALEILTKLKAHGLQTLLVSISPFHNEYIPFYKTKGVMQACQEAGVQFFPWVMEFYDELDSFDDRRIHSLGEYVLKFGDDYVKNIPNRFWVHFGGRALQTFSRVLPLQPLSQILAHGTSCPELADTSHFHFDLYENYIPGLCSGLSIRAEDLGKPLAPEKYPLISLLYAHGIKAFLELAQRRYQFEPKKHYLGKCHLCFEIRKFLVTEKKMQSIELQPLDFYEQI